MTSMERQLARAERIGLAEAKANLSGLVSRVEASGEPCVIMRYNQPVAMLVSIPKATPHSNRARGTLAAYANAERRSAEHGAFERAMVEKHGNAS